MKQLLLKNNFLVSLAGYRFCATQQFLTLADELFNIFWGFGPP
jgi:hypothetical protein